MKSTKRRRKPVGRESVSPAREEPARERPRWPRDDPDYKEEARRYERPLPSRRFLQQWFLAHQRPASVEEIVTACGLDPERDAEALRRRLNAMVRQGILLLNRAGLWCLTDHLPLVGGLVQAARDGMGYVLPLNGDPPLTLAPVEMARVFEGDRVLVRPMERPDGVRMGQIVEILERVQNVFAGRFVRERGVALVRPVHPRLAQDFPVAPGEDRGAKEGEYVRAEILHAPERPGEGIVRVIERFGDGRGPGVHSSLAISTFGLRDGWNAEVLEEVAELREPPDRCPDERRDLEEWPLVTIDGSDARDFDDAVAVRPLPGGGTKLLVAIADVSVYVLPGRALDREARARTTSVYFVDRVVPMLPERLSNDLCSLRPEVPRYCLWCEMEIDGEGEVRRSRFGRGLMRSRARLTYDEVASACEDRDPAARRALGPLLESLEGLYGLYARLRRARRRRGALDFESGEVKVRLDRQGRVTSIDPVPRRDAHRLIEECMIAANSEAARFLEHRHLAALYRVHEPPPADRLEILRENLAAFGLRLGGGETPPVTDYARLLERVAKKPERRLIEMLVLRSLNRAVYDPRPLGHFGLGLRHYTHFTSPIRRYPDLLVHRAIAGYIEETPAVESPTSLDEIGVQCSFRERVADEASRFVLQRYILAHLEKQLGSVHAGLVTGVMPFGLFVELEGLYVNGLVHVSSLPPDYYRHDPRSALLRGEQRGFSFRLGSRMNVRIVRIDVDELKMDLAWEAD
jgi:ribonuclease R